MQNTANKKPDKVYQLPNKHSCVSITVGYHSVKVMQQVLYINLMCFDNFLQNWYT